MEPDALRKLAVLPESEVLEFKTRVPPPSSVAKQISAFANTRGGTLIVGVREDGEIVGIRDPARAKAVLERAVESVSPPVAVESETVTVDGKQVLVATVRRGTRSPYLAGGQALQRVGDRIAPITSDVLYNGIRERAEDPEAMLREIRRLTIRFEELNRAVMDAQS